MESKPNTSDELAISPGIEYPVVEDGTYEATYNGFKPFAEETVWGPKQGARLQFKITKGKFLNQTVSFKGNFFQDQTTGRWVVGMRSKLAEVIRVITGGTETINKGHIGTKLLVQIKVNTSKKTGKRYSNVEAVIAMPKYDEPTPSVQTANATTAPVLQTLETQKAKPTNSALLDDLTSLEDFKV